jgi:hypothetical protein
MDALQAKIAGAFLASCNLGEVANAQMLDGGGLRVELASGRVEEYSAEQVSIAFPIEAAIVDWSIIGGELVDVPITIDLSDGVSDEEAAAAGRVLASRKSDPVKKARKRS